MRRSRAVRLTLVASASSAAAGAAACAGGGASAAEAVHCVEGGSNRVVADSLCPVERLGTGGRTNPPAGEASGDFGAADSGGARGVAGRTTTGGGPHLAPAFFWYYGGRVAGGYASAGQYVPGSGVRYRSPSGHIATGGGRPGFFSRVFGAGRGGGAASASEGSAFHGSAGRGGVSRGGFGATGAGHAGGGS